MGSEAFRVFQCGQEACAPDKRPVRVIPQFHMVHFILSGQGWFDGRLLRAGQGFVCRQNCVSSYRPKPEDPWKYAWLDVSGSEPDRILGLIPMEDGVFSWDLHRDADALCGMHLVPVRRDTSIWDFRWKTDGEGVPFQTVEPIDDASRELMCMSVFCRVMAGVLGGTQLKDERNYVRRAVRFFEQNYEQGVTVQQAAEALGLSRAYLRNLFVEETGESPQACLMRLRMERAERLLSGDYGIGEIANAVGYPDVLQFSRIFRKYHGMSPTEFRRRNRPDKTRQG